MARRPFRTHPLRPFLAGLAFAGALLPVLDAQASTVTLDTRYYAGGSLSSAAAYQSTIDALDTKAATGGYGDATLASYDGISNHSVFGGPSGNVAFRFEVDFNAANAGTWNFRIGPDFGLGGAVFLDGAVAGFRTSDMWWAGSYANASQDFAFSANLASGNHSLLIYGLEACCDGGQQAQFQAPGATGFTSFGARDGINPVAGHVPEPGSLPLFGAAGLGLVALRRRVAGERP